MRQSLLFIVISSFILASCSSSENSFETLPDGDASRGESLYTESINAAPACSSCHALTEERVVGPGFAGFSDTAGTRVEEQTAEAYTYNSITNPSGKLVDGYGNLMYTEYRSKLSEQDIADLIAFLLTQ